MQCLYRALCVSLCTSLCGAYAVRFCKSYKYNQKLNTFDYASFMRVIRMRRMFQVLLYAGFMHHFSLNTFRYKGLLNCAGEHRGELCWESADFRAQRPRPLLLLLLLLFYFFFAEMALQRKEPLNQR